MCKFLILTISLIATVSHAETYKCVGLDNPGVVTVELEMNKATLIGKFQGDDVYLEMMGKSKRIALLIHQKEIPQMVSIVFNPGPFVYYFNTGGNIDDARSVECMPPR